MKKIGKREQFFLERNYIDKGSVLFCESDNTLKSQAKKDRDTWVKQQKALGYEILKKSETKVFAGYGKKKCYSGRAYKPLTLVDLLGEPIPQKEREALELEALDLFMKKQQR